MSASLWGQDREIAAQLIQAAVLAPSSHNTQPWLFRLHEGGLELRADRTRALPVNDPDDRELTISCGCALFNLRVAAAHAGVALHIHLLPDAQDTDLLATVEMASAGAVASDLAPYWDALTWRRTYRKAFVDRAVNQIAVDALGQAAAQEFAWLQALEGEATRHDLAALAAEGDALQWANPSWRRELAQWMHPRRRGDGISVPGLALPLAQLVVRRFDLGDGVGANDQQLADASPLIAVLGTTADGPEHWLIAGQALQRVLLKASALDLQASYLNQPVQVPALRQRLQQLLGQKGVPQIVLRVGHPAHALAATPRRSVDDVIETQ